MDLPYKSRLWTDYEELVVYVKMRAALTGEPVRVVCVEDGWLIPDFRSVENFSTRWDDEYVHEDADTQDDYEEHLAECSIAADRWRDEGYTFGNGQENDDASIMDGWKEAKRYG